MQSIYCFPISKISFVLILRAETTTFAPCRSSLRVIACVEFMSARKFSQCVYFMPVKNTKSSQINSKNPIVIRKIYSTWKRRNYRLLLFCIVWRYADNIYAIFVLHEEQYIEDVKHQNILNIFLLEWQWKITVWFRFSDKYQIILVFFPPFLPMWLLQYLVT